jgi:hypothetical protein
MWLKGVGLMILTLWVPVRDRLATLAVLEGRGALAAPSSRAYNYPKESENHSSKQMFYSEKKRFWGSITRPD